MAAPTPPGWYQAPFDPPGTGRWWDGYAWGPPAPVPQPPQADRANNVALALGVVAIAFAGAALADFTQVSLLTGTGTVWTGAVIAVVAAIAAIVIPRVPTWAAVTAVLLALTGVGSAIYDEVQLHNKRQELNNILNSDSSAKKLSHTAVERYIEQQFNVNNVDCNAGVDFPMTSDGAPFTCVDTDTNLFTATMTGQGQR